MGKQLNYDFLNCARRMPPLLHTTGTEFDIEKSQVAAWLSSKPDIKQKIFNMATNQGVIRFDSETRTWRGVDYHGD